MQANARPGPGTIVVGVDGSPASERALEWAVAEARLRRLALHLVCAVEARVRAPGIPYAIGAGLAVSVEAARTATEELVHRHCQGLEVTCVTPFGSPGTVLVEEAEGADLLVVGSRGRGRIRSALLGSTTTFCAHHTRCPLVVVGGGESVAA